jgi:hypothetical protein
MLRISVVLFTLFAAQVATISVVSAQKGEDACSRDVVRFCRAVMNNGDAAVLGCLKEHRAQVSKPCEKVLNENGH